MRLERSSSWEPRDRFSRSNALLNERAARRPLPGEIRPNGEQRSEQCRAFALRGQLTIGGEERLCGARCQLGGAGELAGVAEGQAADCPAHGVCGEIERAGQGLDVVDIGGPRSAAVSRNTAARRGSGRRSCDSRQRPDRDGVRTAPRRSPSGSDPMSRQSSGTPVAANSLPPASKVKRESPAIRPRDS